MNPSCVVFDCDGVLLDSNAMKTDAFASVLSHHDPKEVDAFLAYQRTAFGLSRYRMVDRFFDTFSSRPPADGEKDRMLTAFSEYCREHYVRMPIIDGALDVLRALEARKAPMFVVSGSDELELNEVLATLNLSGFFRKVFGSPRTKLENLRRVEADLGAPHAITFVGDARADWQASQDFGCRFVYVAPWSADPAGMQALRAEAAFPEISNLRDLPALMDPPVPLHAETAR